MAMASLAVFDERLILIEEYSSKAASTVSLILLLVNLSVLMSSKSSFLCYIRAWEVYVHMFNRA